MRYAVWAADTFQSKSSADRHNRQSSITANMSWGRSMEDGTLQPCESLRTIESLCQPDVRNGYFSRFDRSTGHLGPITADTHLADIASFTLSAEVPEPIRIQFETARNLYAYAWFVFRFYPVAEQHALTSLEFALRERLATEVARSGTKRPSGLKGWLTEARKRGAISNDRFSWRTERAMQRARNRAEFQLLEDMQRLGLTEAVIDHSNVQPVPEDFDENWIDVFIETLPEIRNRYAHGSDALHNTVLRTFEIVRELINQLFPPAS